MSLDEEWQKLVDCPNINVKNNTGYKIQCDRIAGIFHSDGKICGISDRNGIKESPLWICHVVDKMINYTGTDIYSVSVFKLFLMVTVAIWTLNALLGKEILPSSLENELAWLTHVPQFWLWGIMHLRSSKCWLISTLVHIWTLLPLGRHQVTTFLAGGTSAPELSTWCQWNTLRKWTGRGKMLHSKSQPNYHLIGRN